MLRNCSGTGNVLKVQQMLHICTEADKEEDGDKVEKSDKKKDGKDSESSSSSKSKKDDSKSKVCFVFHYLSCFFFKVHWGFLKSYLFLRPVSTTSVKKSILCLFY